MTLSPQEQDDIIAAFDREFKGVRLDKEAKEFWPKNYIYQNGEVNELFLAYRRGVVLGKGTCSPAGADLLEELDLYLKSAQKYERGDADFQKPAPAVFLRKVRLALSKDGRRASSEDVR